MRISQLRRLWTDCVLPEALDSAMASALRWIFRVCTVIGAPAVYIVFVLRVLNGESWKRAWLVPVVFTLGLVVLSFAFRFRRVHAIGACLSLWLAMISIVSQYSDRLHLGMLICWILVAVVCGLFVSLRWLAFMLVLMMGAVLWSFYVHGQSLPLLMTGLTLFFAMAGVAVAMGFIRLVLIDAFEREVSLREQAHRAEEARIQAEKAMLASQHFSVLGRVAAGVAHDVNNVLTVVLSTADLLLLGLPEQETQACLNDMKRIAEETAVATRELLSFAPKGRCSPRLVVPAELVGRMSRTLCRVLPDTITLHCHVSGHLPVLMDPSDMQRVILNLVVNARDAMPQGGEIGLSVLEEVDGDGRWWVLIEVRDSGQGMSAEVQARLFEPFFTTKPAGKGTGLGLKMVRQMMEDAGGSIEVSSELGRGSRFCLRLPRVRQALADESSLRPSLLGGGRVLVCLRRLEIAMLARRILERGGYHVEVIQDSRQASRHVSEGPVFDVLLLEWGASEEPEVLRAFLRRCPDGGVLGLMNTHRRVPGLLDSEPERVALIEAPFSANELLLRVQELLERSHLTRESPARACGTGLPGHAEHDERHQAPPHPPARE